MRVGRSELWVRKSLSSEASSGCFWYPGDPLPFAGEKGPGCRSNRGARMAPPSPERERARSYGRIREPFPRCLAPRLKGVRRREGNRFPPEPRRKPLKDGFRRLTPGSKALWSTAYPCSPLTSLGREEKTAPGRFRSISVRDKPNWEGPCPGAGPLYVRGDVDHRECDLRVLSRFTALFVEAGIEQSIVQRCTVV